MEDFLVNHPDIAHTLLICVFKAAMWIIGLMGTFVLILFGLIGYFGKKQLEDIKLTFKDINVSIRELYTEIRGLNKKVGRYDQIAEEHMKLWGNSPPNSVERRKEGNSRCEDQVEDSQAE